VKLGMELDRKRNYELCMYVCKSTITNMATMRNLEFICDEFNVDKICSLLNNNNNNNNFCNIFTIASNNQKSDLTEIRSMTICTHEPSTLTHETKHNLLWCWIINLKCLNITLTNTNDSGLEICATQSRLFISDRNFCYTRFEALKAVWMIFFFWAQP
jgi:hypothetical protein